LKLGNNLIRNFDNLKQLGKVDGLINLDLSSNPVTEVQDYREALFELIPSLEVLDGLDKEGQEQISENMS
jgi:acidic leucine-rich nuclear phosphoprotein 32 family protein A/C/D